MEGLVIYVLIGVTAGILSGFFGIGGVIIIPALAFLEGFSQLKAQGTSLVASLVALLPPVGILAFFEYYKRGYANLYAGITICIAMIISAKFGAQLATLLPLDIMRKALAYLLF